MTLHIAPGFDLPVDAVTETFGILAVRRAGKSNAAVVLAEEMYDNGIPWVAVDPKGDWWGVRAAGDGETPGLAVLVFGGLHGDVPLEPTAGRLVADLVAEQRITCVLDVSEMTKADQRRFLTDFADQLYRKNREPLHVFCEEADEYIPQRVMADSTKLVGAFETLIKRGGFRGIGVTLITQRSASLNKDVLTQVGTLIAMRTPSPQDRKAILAWIDYHAASKDVIDELPTLDAGEAWVFSPQWLNVLTKIRFRRRRTFDSGATPKVGGKPKPPARLADVDLAAITAQMADTIERAKADDPKELRKRIAGLERDLAAVKADRPEPERVEVPVMPESYIDRIQLAITEWAESLSQANDIVNELVEQINMLRAIGRSQTSPSPVPSRVAARSQRQGRGEPTRAAEPSTAPASRPAVRTGDGGIDRPTGPQQKILDALEWLATVGIGPASRIQVAMIAGYHPRTKGFTNSLSSMSTLGYITYPQPGYLEMTATGAALANTPETPPTSDALQQMVYTQIGNAKARIMRELVAIYPEQVSRTDLAARLDYHERTKGFTNSLSSLRTLGLLDYPAAGWVAATPLMFLHGAR